MKKEKLIELYDLLKDTYSNINSKDIMNLSDNDINLILNYNKYTSLVMRLLKNNDFKSLLDVEKEYLISCLDSSKEYSIAEDIYLVITNKSVIKSGKLLDVVRYMSLADADYKSDYIKEIVCYDRFLFHKDLVYFMETILNSNSENAYSLLRLICNDKINSGKTFKEIVSIIENSNRNYSINEYIYQVATNEKVINSDRGTALAKIIANAKDEVQARYASGLINDNDNIVYSDYALIYTILIANANGESQARNAYLITLDNSVNPFNKREYIRIISNCKEGYQADKGRELIINKDVPEDFKLPLLKLICSSKGLSQAHFATKISFDKKIQLNKNYLNIVKTISQSNNSLASYYEYYYMIDSSNDINNKTIQYLNMIDNFSKKKIDALDYKKYLILNYLNDKDKYRYLDMLNEATSEEDINSIYNNVLKVIENVYDPIEVDKKSENKLELIDFNDKEYNFWESFNKNPDDAIRLLKDCTKDNIEVTNDLVIKKKLIK